MPDFIIGYHGQENMQPPSSPEDGQKQMQKWGEWLTNLGSAVVNPGSPLGASKIVTTAGVLDDDWTNSMFGFTVVSADSLEVATGMAQSCPVLGQGGTLRVAEIMEMPG